MYIPLRSWVKRDTKLNNKGYMLVYVPEHPKSFGGGWYYEHRLTVERSLGRLLESWETVHHINENKVDNFIDNLFLCSRVQHDYAD